SLSRHGLDDALRDVARREVPLLAICIGCQVIFDRSDEDGGTACLGLFPGSVKRFEFPPGVRRKIPHMGWNEVRIIADHPALADVPAGSQLYFVHSYHVVPEDESVVLGTTTYGGVEFPAIVGRGSILALQFHAEKSGPVGLGIIASFLRSSQ
ncbi:MAG TPA: imidazole glycerol phosphate synthase subunit HisH, partial [Planctomycetota bacterium]|nr:imidazole glycerol phosphate synthase subunit HisH [Planctomycetota bacterium]